MSTPNEGVGEGLWHGWEENVLFCCSSPLRRTVGKITSVKGTCVSTSAYQGELYFLSYPDTKAFASSILIGWEVLVFPFGSLSILEVILTRMLAWAMAHEFPQSYPCPELIPTNFQWSLSPSLVLPPSACRPWWWGARWSSTWQLLCRMRVRIPMEPWSTSTTQQGCPINEC